MKRLLLSVLSVLALAIGPLSARAATPLPTAARAPIISVLTFGPGDETFSKFGHDAIWVHDPAKPPERRDLVFNYGTFRFDSPWLILDFLQGKLSYWLSVSSLQRTVAAYRAANRSVSAQELALPPDAARAITAFLHENVKPENAYYRYDYYRDNCATRIRDVLERHLGGHLSTASRGAAAHTYREHTRRLTQDAPFLFFGLDLAMGPLIDAPINEWEEMFLPARVEAKLGELVDGAGVPLVRARRVLFEAERPPIPATPPDFRWGWLGLGVGLGACLYGLSRVRRRWSEVALAIGFAAVGALSGILGVLLLVLWLFTDHDVTYWNLNVLLCPVWALAMPILALDWGKAEPRRASLMMQVVGAAVISGLLALVVRLTGLTPQDNDPALSFFLPLWLGVGFAAWERCGRRLPRSSRAAPDANGAAPGDVPAPTASNS